MDPRKGMCLLQHIGTTHESLSNSFLFSSLNSLLGSTCPLPEAAKLPVLPSKTSFIERRFSLETDDLAPLA